MALNSEAQKAKNEMNDFVRYVQNNLHWLYSVI